MLDQNLVSIVIPCYNQGLFLEEALNSIEAQIYRPLEVIVVDDGSGLDTKNAIQQLSRRFQFNLITQNNQGLSAARNRGIQAAQGEYILPLDADNRLSPDAVALMVAKLQDAQRTNPQTMFVFQDKMLFGIEQRYVPHQPYNLYRLLSDNFADACSLIDRRVFDKGLQFNETMKQGYEDWEFYLRLGLYGLAGVRLPGQTFWYRRWGYSMVSYADTQKHSLLKKIQSELAALYVPQTLLDVKRIWSPGISILSAQAVDIEQQSFQDAELLLYHDGALNEILSAAKGKYVLICRPDILALFQSDIAVLEKWATLGELRGDIDALAIMMLDETVAAYFVRGAYLTQEILPCGVEHWVALAAIVDARHPSFWDFEHQRLLPAGQTPLTRMRSEKRLSRALKNWGKRVIAPRVGFDNAYQVFYHTYQAGQALKRSLRSRRVTTRTAPNSAVKVDNNPDAAGNLIDQGFRHYTKVIFEGEHDV